METSSFVGLGKSQRIFLLIISFVIAVALLIMRTGLAKDRPLDFLARNSLEPELAIHNGHPTLIEFYADWCEACKQMAPSMIELKNTFENKIDVVLLNVDNPRWLDLIDKYHVNGIPHLFFFDDLGNLKGQAIGLKTLSETNQIAYSLLNNESFNDIPGVNDDQNIDSSWSPIHEENLSKFVSPRSHS